MSTSKLASSLVHTGSSDIMAFGLMYDVPIPLKLFSQVISRSAAFKARAEGKLHLDTVASNAAVRPSELARYLNTNRSATILAVHDKGKDAA